MYPNESSQSEHDNVLSEGPCLKNVDRRGSIKYVTHIWSPTRIEEPKRTRLRQDQPQRMHIHHPLF